MTRIVAKCCSGSREHLSGVKRPPPYPPPEYRGREKGEDVKRKNVKREDVTQAVRIEVAEASHW